MRDRPAANGGPPTRAVGRSDKATYTANTGDVELVGTPRVQEGPNLHVATSPDTVMVVSQNSQLTTHGPSRTEIVPAARPMHKRGQANPPKLQQPRLHPLRLCQNHDEPSRACFYSESSAADHNKAETVLSTDQLGQDLRRPSGCGRNQHARWRQRDCGTARTERSR